MAATILSTALPNAGPMPNQVMTPHSHGPLDGRQDSNVMETSCEQTLPYSNAWSY